VNVYAVVRNGRMVAVVHTRAFATLICCKGGKIVKVPKRVSR
jgi:hypothetical protein